MLGAGIERAGDQPIQQRDEAVRRIVGQMRIGDMALDALDGEVGSPTTQQSRVSPRARSQSSTFFVPLIATPSSSPVMRRLIDPAKAAPGGM